jgi:hypothetical protein
LTQSERVSGILIAAGRKAAARNAVYVEDRDILSEILESGGKIGEVLWTVAPKTSAKFWTSDPSMAGEDKGLGPVSSKTMELASRLAHDAGHDYVTTATVAWALLRPTGDIVRQWNDGIWRWFGVRRQFRAVAVRKME